MGTNQRDWVYCRMKSVEFIYSHVTILFYLHQSLPSCVPELNWEKLSTLFSRFQSLSSGVPPRHWVQYENSISLTKYSGMTTLRETTLSGGHRRLTRLTPTQEWSRGWHPSRKATLPRGYRRLQSENSTSLERIDSTFLLHKRIQQHIERDETRKSCTNGLYTTRTAIQCWEVNSSKSRENANPNSPRFSAMITSSNSVTPTVSVDVPNADPRQSDGRETTLPNRS